MVSTSRFLPFCENETKTLDDLSRAGKRLMGFCRTGLLKRLESSGEAFLLLKNWLNLGSNSWEMALSILNRKATALNPHLTDFLHDEGIEDVWVNLQTNAPSKSHFSKQFHRWFDGLKTIRLLKRFTT